MSSVTSIINDIIGSAIERNASDIHIDPLPEETRVLFRIDGLFHNYISINKALHSGIIGRIKVLSRLRTDEHYAAQDGRFKYEENSHAVDIRVSILPTYYGENTVLRLLRQNQSTDDLSILGLDEINKSKLKQALKKRTGMIIITGPTGSGKTTTLYALIKLLAQERLIVTIEDPVEYAIPGIRQVQVGTHKGLTFANGLRSILRQDPDAIMVGEIRDQETAHIAIHAALTGHLLLTTMHTGDAASVLPRLIDMKIEPYLIASTVDLVIAQRLVRKICQDCKKSGCSHCLHSGFKSRVGIYEFLEVNSSIKNLIFKQESANTIKQAAIESGMKTMLDDGIYKAESGLTDMSEVISVLS